MEKFSVFNDKSTGVNAYMPVWVKHQESCLTRLVRIGLVGWLAAFRIIFCMNAFLLALILVTLGDKFRMNSLNGVLRYTLGYLCRIVLVVLGVLQLRVVSHTLGIKSGEEMDGPSAARSGDVVLSNFTSFFDILIHGYLYHVMHFYFINGRGKICCLNLAQAIIFSLRNENCKEDGKYTYLYKAMSASRELGLGPVVLFPEISKSNGQCIHQWNASCFQYSSHSDNVLLNKCQVVFINSFDRDSQLKSQSYSPPHTTYNWFMHLVFLSLQFYYSITVNYTDKHRINKLLDKDKKNNDFVARVRIAMQQLAQNDCTLISSDIKSIQEFSQIFSTLKSNLFQFIF